MKEWSPAGYLLALAFLLGLIGQAEGTQGLVTEVEVEASVEHRYAITRVTTRMYNPDHNPSHLILHMTLPKDALVSSFALDVGGVNYSGSVRERQEARRTYEGANQEGRTAGLLELRGNDLQKLVAKASVEGQTAVTFHVTYEELLHRVECSYRYTVHINPGQRVPRASVRVKVIEREAITNYTILEMPGQEMKINNPSTSVTGGPVSDGELDLLYQHVDPPVGEGLGVDGSFVLTYDITNHADGGEVQRVGNYFAHYFSPERLPRMTTHTVFLLDVSLSMYSTKLDSMKEALNTVLREMQDHDTFEILAFASEVVSIGTFSGEEMEVKRAIRRVRRLVSLGYSNLNAALHHALKAARTGGNQHVVKQILVFTDGHVTSGEINPDTLRSGVRKANTQHTPIFTFIFTDNSKLLEDISSDSGGSARYMDLGATMTEQITSFYREISQPLMTNVTITYPDEDVDASNIVKLGMSNYYSGGEMVVAGKLRPGVSRVRPSINARGKEGPHQLPATRLDSRDQFFASLSDNNVARMWAFLMVKKLLDKAAAPENANSTQELRSKALEIAMKFSFVSPVTSLVVVYPRDKSLLLSLPGGPQSLGNTQPGYLESSGQRRGRRSTQNYVDLDPHFLVHTPGLDLPLCFNYEGRAGVSVRLLHDPQCGIIINGHVASVKQRPNIKFFSRLFLRLGPVNLTVTPELLHVDCLGDDGSPQVDTVVKSLWPFYKKNGRKYKRHTYRRGSNGVRRSNLRERNTKHHEMTGTHAHPNALHDGNTQTSANASTSRVDERVKDCNVNTSWEEGVGRIYGNVMVVLSKKRSLDITIGDGLAHFTIRRSRDRRGQRFLGFYIRNQEIFSPQTHGMMGQFISKRVRRMSPNRTSPIQTRAANVTPADTPEKVMLEVARRGHRKKSQVSGVVGSRYSLMGRTKVRCIKVHTKGPGGVLDRQPRDYLLSCLQC